MIRMIGYELREIIHQSAHSLVYRGIREADGARIVAKLMSDAYPSVELASRFKREYEIGRKLSGRGAIVVHGLEPVRSSWAIVMEDFGARSLRLFLSERRLQLEECLGLGIRIAAALSAVHQQRVVHKDVNPSNIVLDDVGGEVKLIDFGLSTALPRENPSLRSPNVLEGTLLYISPEQTGRMNRSIDYRTDLYSLGVTLYEMLTGRPPFEAKDAVELIHLHIAQRPMPPHEVEPAIPRPVSDIVMKLLAKTAEERYQSAQGLKADLETCLDALSARGSEASIGLERFVPGANDISDRFQVPQKLYGRDADVAVLMKTFERAATGRAELLLVRGASGVGKSALINEMHKPVLARRGSFVAGKFDQLQRDIPYAPLIQAFTDLIHQLLTESEERLVRWRERLMVALGENGQVIVDVIPILERIVGPQPPVPSLGPSEAQIRFNFIFQEFMRAVATAEHPLVLFLDDLQWADLPSLKLIQTLLTDPELRHLLIIGAFRENEVDGAHPLVVMLDTLAKEGAAQMTLSLDPLDASHVEQMVSDTLHCEPERAEGLARLAFERTGGNPFFLGQMLRALYEDNLIDFEPARGRWNWDLEAIRARWLTSDVVELTTRKLQKLPAETRAVLELAACIGNRFDLATLAIASQQPVTDTATHLYQAMEEGLILPLDERWRLAEQGGATNAAYRFLHDRVQQAAYQLVLQRDPVAIHRRIGRLLLASIPAEQREERLFDIVNQLNLGRVDDRPLEERLEAARLNLLAGRKAKASAAHEPALRYFNAGVAQLPESAWTDEYELCFALHLDAMVAEYLNAHIDRGEALSELLLSKARGSLEKAQIYEIRASYATMRNELQRSMEDGLHAMELLGVELPRSLDVQGFFAILKSTQELLGERPASAFQDLPRMTDPNGLAMMRVGISLLGPSYNTNPLLCMGIQLEGVKTTLRYGLAPESVYFLATMGLIHATFLDNPVLAGDYSRLSLQLFERVGTKALKAKVYLNIAGFVHHWTSHLRDSIPLLVESIQAGLESGDLEFTSYAAAQFCMSSIHLGEPLDVVLRDYERYHSLLVRLKLEFPALIIQILSQSCLNLMGRGKDPRLLVGEAFDERTKVPEIIAKKNVSQLAQVGIQKLMLGLFFRDAEAVVVSPEMEECVLAQVGQPSPAIFIYYVSLACLLRCRGALPEEERTRLLEKVEANQQRMKRWAECGPMNWQHRYTLVEAERARLRGDTVAAARLYEEAAQGAVKHRYLNDEALAHELAGEFYRELGRERLARDCFLDAANAYRRWGAEAKVADLERRHAFAFTWKPAASSGVTLETSNSSREGTSALDLKTVMKAARAISGEIVLDRLLDTLMRIAIENAGAERGCLVLQGEERLMVSVAGDARGQTQARLPAPVDEGELLDPSIVYYVARTGESVVLNDAAAEGRFVNDPYVTKYRPHSVLCTPLHNQGKLVAIIYLENNLTAGAFTADRLEILRLLSAQAALSIHNAQLFARVEGYSHTLEQKVEERTRQLQSKNEELARTLNQLRAIQTHLVTQEKLASLGALTAGIAHEIKNPLNFVKNFAELSVGLADELSTSLASVPQLDPATRTDVEEILQSLRSNASKISDHGLRANQIIEGMLMHSRNGSGQREPTNLNTLLAESISLAYHGFHGKSADFTLDIHTDYAPDLGLVEVAGSDVSRVFINIINNACYALQQKQRAKGQAFAPRLEVRTRDLGDRVQVVIRDNGTGIPQSVRDKVFNPFFTTKAPGEGTGLGLSISHDIIVGKYLGEMRLESVEGEFSEFVIGLPKRAEVPA